MRTNIVLTLALVICLNAGNCAAVKCFTCIFAKCEDPFDWDIRAFTDGCAQCVKTKYGYNVVTRQCLAASIGSNECIKPASGNAVLTCYCSHDGCNGGSSVYVTMATVLVSLLFLAKHVF